MHGRQGDAQWSEAHALHALRPKFKPQYHIFPTVLPYIALMAIKHYKGYLVIPYITK